MDFKELLNRFHAISGLSLEDLASANQSRSLGRWRQALLYVARRFYRVPVVDMGRVMGRDGTTISHMIQRIQGRESEISEIERLVKGLQAVEREEEFL